VRADGFEKRSLLNAAEFGRLFIGAQIRETS
jgi:hypothetical protein